MAEEIELAYIAGFFDGEGCVKIWKRSDRSDTAEPFLRIVIAQTKRDVLEWIQSIVGGSIYTKGSSGNNKEAYTLEIQKIEDCKNFIESIEKYCRVKNKQLNIAGLFIASKGNRTTQMTDLFIQALGELNKRGVDNE